MRRHRDGTAPLAHTLVREEAGPLGVLISHQAIVRHVDEEKDHAQRFGEQRFAQGRNPARCHRGSAAVFAAHRFDAGLLGCLHAMTFPGGGLYS